MPESLPTSVSAFPHRRARADSTTSFSFYQDERDGSPVFDSEGTSIQELDEVPFEEDEDDEDEDADEEETGLPYLERQLLSANDHTLHRRASTQSRNSSRSKLLRSESGTSTGSGYGAYRISQKVYMANEDLYVVIAGFKTTPFGEAAYLLFCVCTFGLAWLLLRWLPRLHVRLVGQPCQLRQCQWVVIEVGITDCGPLHGWIARLTSRQEPMERNVDFESGRSAVRKTIIEHIWGT